MVHASRSRWPARALSVLVLLSMVLAASGATSGRQAIAASAGKWNDYSGPAVTISVWTYPQDDPTLLNLEKSAFEKKFPKITVKFSILPESNYGTKINTALQGHRPPDVAIIEDQAWMKAGEAVKLDPYFKQWGVNPNDFNPGGVARLTLEQDPK